MAGVTLLTACDNALNETDYTYSISSETFYNTVEEANADGISTVRRNAV